MLNAVGIFIFLVLVGFVIHLGWNLLEIFRDGYFLERNANTGDYFKFEGLVPS